VTKKPRLATVWLGGCSGCHMSFLDLDERLEGLLAAVGRDERRHCTACFDGNYPVDVPLDVDKFALERG